MLRLRFREYDEAAEKSTNASEIESRQTCRRWCFRLAVGAGVLALLAISLGFATFGIAIYIAALLPFALFS
jgi:hypothetical protein